jgi:hypothetical protein
VIDRRKPDAGGGDPDGSAGGAGVLPRGIDARAAPEHVRRLALPFGELAITAATADLALDRVIAAAPLRRRLTDHGFGFRIGFPEAAPVRGYRAETAGRGVYQGHNLGPPAIVSTTPRQLAGYIPGGRVADYEQLFWSLGIKVMCALAAHASHALHVKATALVDPDGRVVLLVGRGQAGKTTLARFLVEHARFRRGGNTHALVREDHAWSLATWVRERGPGGDVFDPAVVPAQPIDGPLRGILIVEKNSDGRTQRERLVGPRWSAFFQAFVCGTGAWDLKEDIADAIGPGAHVAAAALEREHRQLARLLDTIGLGFVSVDVRSAECRAAIPAIVEELLPP